jgi:hypothetical protein
MMREDFVVARVQDFGSLLWFQMNLCVGLPFDEVGATVASFERRRCPMGREGLWRESRTSPLWSLSSESELVGPMGHEGLWLESRTSPMWSLSSESELSVIYLKSLLFGIGQHGLQKAFAARPS